MEKPRNCREYSPNHTEAIHREGPAARGANTPQVILPEMAKAARICRAAVSKLHLHDPRQRHSTHQASPVFKWLDFGRCYLDCWLHTQQMTCLPAL
jgi:hypothetical protein